MEIRYFVSEVQHSLDVTSHFVLRGNRILTRLDFRFVRGLDFQSITDGIDTRPTAGRFFFHVMASLG
jgi:hypothetical protein